MSEKFSLIARLTLSFALVVSGCAIQRPQIPVDRQYQHPAVSASNASIFGSRGTTVAWRTDTFVRSVENKRVMDGAETLDKAVLIESGNRHVTVEANSGNYKCTANFTFDAKPGASYQIGLRTHPDGILAGSYCDFWLSDRGSQEKVTEVIRQPLSQIHDRPYIPFVLPVKK